MSTVDLAGARWRKSSRSGSESGSDCVEVALVTAGWRKSTFSTGEAGSNCIEVAFVGPAAALRDSKNPDGPALVVPVSTFQRCIDAVSA